MIEPDTIREIVDTYARHGWELRRVLLSASLKRELADEAARLFAGVRIVDSDLDAAWFSRQSRPDSVAWEIRRLGNLPFALVTSVAGDAGPDELEAALSETQQRLRETSRKFAGNA
ncbi:MAG: hypothetical protein ACK4S4_09100 [Pyrinomonadaceae bacterium]